MRVKVLGHDGSRKVLLVYPRAFNEYRQALETLGRTDGPAPEGAGTDVGRSGHGRQAGGYVVTTEEQRHRWGFPDRSAGARLVDEEGALEALRDAAAPASAVEGSAEAAPSPGKDALSEEFAAVRALAAPGPRVERGLAALEGGMLPAEVQETVRLALRTAAGSGKAAVERALERAAMAVALPWRARAPSRFDPVRLREALDRTHAGLDRVKSRLVELFAAKRHAGGLLTMEAPSCRGGSPGRRGRGGAARGARSDAGRNVPGPPCRLGLRPLRGAVRGHGQPPRSSPGRAGGRQHRGRGTRLHRGREARHRGRALATLPARAPRADRRPGPRRRRRGRRRRAGLHAGSGGVGLADAPGTVCARRCDGGPRGRGAGRGHVPEPDRDAGGRRRFPRRSSPAVPGGPAWRSACAGRPPAATCSSSRPAACPARARWS